MAKKKTSKKSVVAKAADAVKKTVKKVKESECTNCMCTEAKCGCECCS